MFSGRAKRPVGDGWGEREQEKRVELRDMCLFTRSLFPLSGGGVQVEVIHEYVHASEETKAV